MNAYVTIGKLRDALYHLPSDLPVVLYDADFTDEGDFVALFDLLADIPDA